MTLDITNKINSLSRHYTEQDVMYGEGITSTTEPNHKGFYGSSSIIFMTNNDSITISGPVCIAAPLVNLVAKKAIQLGVDDRNKKRGQLKLYVPTQFTISTQHLTIGNLQFDVKPERMIISCKKLTVQKKNPEYFDLIKESLMYDDTQIKILQEEMPTIEEEIS